MKKNNDDIIILKRLLRFFKVGGNYQFLHSNNYFKKIYCENNFTQLHSIRNTYKNVVTSSINKWLKGKKYADGLSMPANSTLHITDNNSFIVSYNGIENTFTNIEDVLDYGLTLYVYNDCIYHKNK